MTFGRKRELKSRKEGLKVAQIWQGVATLAKKEEGGKNSSCAISFPSFFFIIVKEDASQNRFLDSHLTFCFAFRVETPEF